MGSFLYPRTIDIHRAAASDAVGSLGYSGEVAATEVPVVVGLPCSIQERREGSGNSVGLPGDGRKTIWWIFIPLSKAPLGLIRNLDIVIDDIGTRYQVVSPYWDSLGYRLSAIVLEA